MYPTNIYKRKSHYINLKCIGCFFCETSPTRLETIHVLNMSSSIPICDYCQPIHVLWHRKREEKEKPTLGNPMWIWACWPYHAQESPWCKVGFTAYLVVGELFGIIANTGIVKHFSTNFCERKQPFLNSQRHTLFLIPLYWIKAGMDVVNYIITKLKGCLMFNYIEFCYHPTLLNTYFQFLDS